MLTSKESPNYSEIHRNFKTYKNIIRRSIMLAKRDYYIKTFSKYSKNLRMTWNAINETLNRHKSKCRFPAEFKLANGKIISDHKVQMHLMIILLVLVHRTQKPLRVTLTILII